MPQKRVSRLLKLLLVRWHLCVSKKRALNWQETGGSLKIVIGEILVKRWFAKVSSELRKISKG